VAVVEVAALFELAPQVHLPSATGKRIPGPNRQKRSPLRVLCAYEEPDPLCAQGLVLAICSLHRDPLSSQQIVGNSIDGLLALGAFQDAEDVGRKLVDLANHRVPPPALEITQVFFDQAIQVRDIPRSDLYCAHFTSR
jgi:hypothetical protein